MSARARKIAVLSALYFVQGMPFSFVTGALSLYLIDRGIQASALGFLGVLFLPYWLKALWAPLVDRFGGARFGRRRSWILPLQLLLAGTCLAASSVTGHREVNLSLALGLVLLMNLFVAAQDVAVDGRLPCTREGRIVPPQVLHLCASPPSGARRAQPPVFRTSRRWSKPVESCPKRNEAPARSSPKDATSSSSR